VLGLSAGNAQFCEEGEARHLLLRAGIDFLRERRKSAKGEHEVHLYEDLLHQYQHRLEDIDECGPDGSNPEKTAHGLTTNHLLPRRSGGNARNSTSCDQMEESGTMYTAISSASSI
jgi:hypothetical protein